MVIYFFAYFYRVSLSKRFFEPRSSHFTFGSGCTVFLVRFLKARYLRSDDEQTYVVYF